MTLSDWLTVLSLGFVVYGLGVHAWGRFAASRKAAQERQRAQGVKSKPRKLAFKKRSPRSNVQNAVNAGSTQQEAVEPSVNVQNVQVPPAKIAAPAGPLQVPDGAAPEPGGDFTLSPRELAQLGEALSLYREGATIEQAVGQAFGVTKGGTAGWKRAKDLFDAATVAPGAAPAGTYAAPAAPARRRRAR